MYNPGFSIFKLSSGIKKNNKKKTFVFSRTKKRADAIKEKRRNRMTMSEASVNDVIVLTYDVTACMCVNVHASVLICVPVCVTLSQCLLLLLRNAEPHF